jgi:hypothetical protein
MQVIVDSPGWISLQLKADATRDCDSSSIAWVMLKSSEGKGNRECHGGKHELTTPAEFSINSDK